MVLGCVLNTVMTLPLLTMRLMIAPNRRSRELRCYRRQWKVERLFVWMHNFCRLVTRWEYNIENFLGFVHLACLQMMLRYI